MRLLLDECVPRRLKKEFAGHEVKTAQEAGFAGLKNGELLRAAQKEFDVPITVDMSMRHQQNLKSFRFKRHPLAAQSLRLPQKRVFSDHHHSQPSDQTRSLS